MSHHPPLRPITEPQSLAAHRDLACALPNTRHGAEASSRVRRYGSDADVRSVAWHLAFRSLCRVAAITCESGRSHRAFHRTAMRFIAKFRTLDGSEASIELAVHEALANAVVH